MPGGANCYGRTDDELIEDCYQRSFERRGSSDFSPPVMDFDYYYQANKTLNKISYNWNIFIYIYCDGTSFYGYKRDPIIYRDRPLYFRGYNNAVHNIAFTLKIMPPENMDTLMLMG